MEWRSDTDSQGQLFPSVVDIAISQSGKIKNEESEMV